MAASRNDYGEFSAHHRSEKIPPRTILDLDDPDIGIELDLPREVSLRVGFGRGLRFQRTDEGTIRGPRLVECALRRGPEHLGGSIKPRDLDEHRTGLVRAAPAQHGL